MTSFLTRSAVVLTATFLLAGCSTSGINTTPSPASSAAEWTAVLAQVGQEVQGGRYAVADRLLLDFQERHGSTAEAPEAMFYRALYKLDPSNPAVATHEAETLLDGLLDAPLVSPHRTEAMVLRRVVSALEAKPAVVTVGVPKDAAATHSDNVARDEELVKLKEELTKANAELERIKRRVATPKP